jgi:hypothetical protein
VNALQELRRPEDVARARGKQISEVLPWRPPEAVEAAEPPVRESGPVEGVRGNREEAEPPVRASGPVEGVRGNREVPPTKEEAASTERDDSAKDEV